MESDYHPSPQLKKQSKGKRVKRDSLASLDKTPYTLYVKDYHIPVPT